MLDAHMLANIDYQADEDDDEPKRARAPQKRGFKL
jgi:hypothetical protein